MESANNVGLDTNMLTAIFEFKIDIFGEIRGLLGNVAFVVPEQVAGELEMLGKRNKKLERGCRIAEELMIKNNVKKVNVAGNNADAALLELSKEMPIATNDKALREKIKSEGGRVLILRQRKYVVFA